MKRVEKSCEESVEACNMAVRQLTDNGALIKTILEPYAGKLSKIKERY
ncbi:hypothetical protein H3259_22930 [Escherichia coli]|nr:hypothetical protein [Escherichia coli]MBA5827538.1 hypothetical protein [Escherichia coli]